VQAYKCAMLRTGHAYHRRYGCVIK